MRDLRVDLIRLIHADLSSWDWELFSPLPRQGQEEYPSRLVCRYESPVYRCLVWD